jgi:DNA repair photolyase
MTDLFSDIQDNKKTSLGQSKVDYKQASSILTKASGFMESYDFTLNPYSGCSFGCTYCYAAFFSRTEEQRNNWGHWLTVKENALQLLIKLRKKPLTGKTIYMSSVTDPYQPLERDLKLTRSLLRELADFHQPRLVIQTRSPISARDIDIFKQFKTIQVNMTITTDSENVRKVFEPLCPSNTSRLKAIKEINDAGINACITMTPLLPIENAEEFAVRLKETGIKKFIVQPFHSDRGKFIAGTREAAMNLIKQMCWTDEKYKQVESILMKHIDAKKTGEEMWLLSRGGDLCYDRPTIGFNYSLWYHPKRINTFLRYFTDLIYDARNERSIEIFDLGAGTGAVLWAVGLIVSGLKALKMPCPNIRVINIDTSAFMIIYSYNYLWKSFIREYPEATEISREGDYRLNSWSNLDEDCCNNIWLCASYLFDHSENSQAIADEFKAIVTRYKPNKVLLLSALPKRQYVDAVADAVAALNYGGYNSILSNQIFSGGLNGLYQFRNRISQLHNLGLTGTPQWNIDSLYGRVLVNNNPQLGLDFNNVNLFIQPERNRAKIKLTPQQEEAAAVNNRPTLVIGPAGCGKSVVLTQKIRNLIHSMRIGNEYNPSLKILVSTFNKGLVRYLGDWIEQLLEPNKFTRHFGTDFYGRQSDHSFFRFTNSHQNNIIVMHFDLLPSRLGGIRTFNITANGGGIEEFHFAKMNAAITTYLNANNINRNDFQTILNAEFLLDEYQRVIYGFECNNEREYQIVERTGRGNMPQLRYNSRRRKIIWGILRTYLQDLRNNQLESFIIRRHRLIKKFRADGFQNKFSHIVVDEFQDCTRADYEIFYQMLQDPNNLTLAGDIAQSINLGTALHIPRTDEQRNFLRKRLEGSFRLPFRVSECIRPLSELINQKFGERDGIRADIINPYKGAPPGSRPIFVFAQDTNSAASKISEIFFTYQKALKLDKVTIFERDAQLNLALTQKSTPSETEIILRAKGLEKNCVVWSTRINVDTATEKEEFVYTILTRTVSLLIIVVFPDIQQDYINIIRGFVENRLIRWDEESETKYQELRQVIHTTIIQEDQDNSEDNQVANEEPIDALIV